MKHIPFFITFILVGVIFYAVAGTQRSKYDDLDSNSCFENEVLYEPMLIPTREDSNNFVDFFKKYPNTGLPDYKFVYEYLPLIRGLADTSLFAEEHYSHFNFLTPNTRFEFIISPLIIEGEVMKELPPDTSIETGNKLFATTFLIKIKSIIKSKYNLKNGDVIVAKTNMYGYQRSSITKNVTYFYNSVTNKYQEGKVYLFVLDRVQYMRKLYQMEHNLRNAEHSDIYCPYTFSLTMTSHLLSQKYIDNNFDKSTIIKFLKNK